MPFSVRSWTLVLANSNGYWSICQILYRNTIQSMDVDIQLEMPRQHQQYRLQSKTLRRVCFYPRIVNKWSQFAKPYIHLRQIPLVTIVIAMKMLVG
jgi:hypothetical protein